MPKGIINPKGKIHLNESSRDMTPIFYGESDKKLGLIENDKLKTERPFSKIISRKDIIAIQNEIRRLYKLTTKKSSVIVILRDKFNFNKTEAENIYFNAVTNNRIKIKKKRKAKMMKKGNKLKLKPLKKPPPHRR